MIVQKKESCNKLPYKLTLCCDNPTNIGMRLGNLHELYMFRTKMHFNFAA